MYSCTNGLASTSPADAAAGPGIRAARAFWFLEFLGHPNVRVLDGGFTAWAGPGLPVTTDAVVPTPSTWHGTPDPSRHATIDQVRERLGNPEICETTEPPLEHKPNTGTSADHTAACLSGSR